MHTDFASISLTLRKNLLEQHVELSLGHAQQLLAASMGYKSLAAFQASSMDSSDIDVAAHLLIDTITLQERMTALEIGGGIPALARLVAVAARHRLVRGGAHETERSLHEFIHGKLEEAVLAYPPVKAVRARIQTATVAEIELPFDFSLEQIAVGATLSIPTAGHVLIKEYADRPTKAERIDLQAKIELQRLGKNLVKLVGVKMLQHEANDQVTKEVALKNPSGSEKKTSSKVPAQVRADGYKQSIQEVFALNDPKYQLEVVVNHDVFNPGLRSGVWQATCAIYCRFVSREGIDKAPCIKVSKWWCADDNPTDVHLVMTHQGCRFTVDDFSIENLAKNERDKLHALFSQLRGVRYTYIQNMFGFLDKDGTDKALVFELPFPAITAEPAKQATRTN